MKIQEVRDTSCDTGNKLHTNHGSLKQSIDLPIELEGLIDSHLYARGSCRGFLVAFFVVKS